MQKQQQFYQIFRASSVIGAASVISTIAGVLRSKAFALLLGTSGVGLAGIYFNLMQVAAILSGMGVHISVVRELSLDNSDSERKSRTRRASMILTLGLAGVCALSIWMLRGVLAREVLHDPTRTGEVGWLALGAASMVIGAGFAGILQGLRHVGDYAKASILGSFMGSTTAIAMAYLGGVEFIYAIALCVPISGTLVVVFFLARLPDPGTVPRWRNLMPQMRSLLSQGGVLMLSVVLQQGVMLYVRTHIARTAGLETAGYFHAAWVISAIYMTLVLQALGTDFFPRLTSVIDDSRAAVTAMNQAVIVALLLATPMVIGGIGGAALVLRIFFSDEFTPAADLLQLFSLGNLLKVLSITMAYTALSKGWKGTYFGLELIWSVLFFTITAGFYERFGLSAIGWAYLVSYGVHISLTFVLNWRAIGFRLEQLTVVALILAAVTSGITTFATLYGDRAGLVVGLVMGLISIASSIVILQRIVPFDTRLGRILNRLPHVFRATGQSQQ